MSNSVKLIPYFSFSGNCEEALNFYKGVLGGELSIASRWDNPAMNAPADYKNKILHARLEVNDVVTLYGSDVGPGTTAKKNSGDISISLQFDDLESGKKAFAGLSAGGKVNMPFEKQFWGAWYGGLTDKYGMSWNVNFMDQP